MASEQFRREDRLRRNADFQRVYKQGRSAADRSIVVYGLKSAGGERRRLGLSVSRKVGGAVVRNRWKRLLREAFRQSRQQLPQGLDLIVIARGPRPPALAALKQSLVTLAGQVARKLRPPASRPDNEGRRHGT